MKPHEDLIEFLTRAKRMVKIMESRESTGNQSPDDYDLENLAKDFRIIADCIDNKDFDKILK